MNKHTPGPWELVRDDNPNSQFISNLKDGKNTMVICCAPGQELYESYKAWEANAKLIAAAPELLEALKELCLSHGADWDTRMKAFDKATAAIKKATE